MGPTVIYYMHNVSTTKENYRESLPERQYGQTEARSGDSMSDGRKTRRTILWGKKWTKWTGCEWQRADKGWELHQPRQFISSDNFISIVTVLWNRPPQMRASSLALGWVNPWRECFQRYPRSIHHSQFQVPYVMAGFSNSLEIIDNVHLPSVAPADMEKNLGKWKTFPLHEHAPGVIARGVITNVLTEHWGSDRVDCIFQLYKLSGFLKQVQLTWHSLTGYNIQ